MESPTHICLAFVLLAQGPSTAGPYVQTTRHGPIGLMARISDRTALLSDSVVFELQATAPVGYDLTLPARGAFAEEFEVLDLQPAGPIAQPDGRQRWELRVKLESLTPGRRVLPALVVRYRKVGTDTWETAHTEPVAIEFHGSVPESAGIENAKPNPAPLAWPVNVGAIVAGVAAGLVAALGAALLGGWLWTRRRSHATLAPPVAAHQKALQALAEIEQAGWLERGDFDVFYTRLSEIVRQYIEDRFGLRAPDQTTEEFLAGMGAAPELTTSHRQLLARFLGRCDLVKFARGRPGRDEAHAALDSARGFVRETAIRK